MRRSSPSTVLVGILLGLALLAGPLGGCDNGGAPATGDEGPGFSFQPAADSLTVLSTGHLDFQITVDPTAEFSAQWTLDGSPQAIGPSYRFIPTNLGRKTLAVQATAGGSTGDHRWTIEVVNGHALDFAFAPADSALAMVDMEARTFAVTTNYPFAVDYSWRYHGQEVGREAAYLFTAAGTGPDSLQLVYTADGKCMSHTWRMAVAPYFPDPIQVVLVEREPWPGSVRVIWSAADHVVFPLEAYEVAASYSGPIDEENWPEALPLGEVAYSASEEWPRALFKSEDGLVPGNYAWFAVRSRDTHGNLSQILVNGQHQLSEVRWVEGTVHDELGTPLAGVEVMDSVLHLTMTTGADGYFQLGPFADFYALTLWASGDDAVWHDYHAFDLSLEQDVTVDIRLMKRWGSDPSCPDYGADFLTYFRNLTRTNAPSTLRPNQFLYRWESYPVQVYIPEFSNNGLDFKDACVQTLAWWNLSMGEEFFQLSGDPAEAQVIFVFEDRGGGVNGQTSLLLPDDKLYGLGETIPELLEVYVRETFSDPIRIQETSLHELGHVLGVNRHALCNDPGYLMYVTSTGVLNDGWEAAIHEDEKRLVRTIRALPQGYDMGGFR